MFVGITNTPRDYAWGSRSAIADLFGREPSGAPEAELWLGAHSGSPARVIDPSSAGGAETLIDVLGGERLPFLLKILAAASPLSLQAHPTMEQAAVGFERENALGIPLDDPTRNYKDAFHKPEIIFALSERFDALCGFRPVAETRELLTPIAEAAGPLLERLIDDSSLAPVFEWLISRGEGVDALTEAVVAAVVAVAPEHAENIAYSTVVLLAENYPGDPGILISLLLNSVSLSRGEVLYLPAGNIHAYLDGLGVELMAASDNVLRGGLTPKHVDVPELLSVLDFTPVPVPYLRPIPVSAGVEAYWPGVADFELIHVTADAELTLSADAIAISTAGSFALTGASGSIVLSLGESVFIAGESALTVTGEGDLFIATSATAPRA